MMDSTRFKDRVFLISGAARGIGRALATRVIAEGGKVLIGDLRHELGEALATELGPNAQYQPLDVTQKSDWLEAVANMVCFLLSDESRYMTGSELAIDGGAAI